MKQKFREIFGMLAVLTAAVLVLSFPTQTAGGVEEGIDLCLSRVVPSVFPMMLVCVLAVECGFAQRAGKLLSPVSERLFRLPGEAAAAVLMSLVGGYPAGAKAVDELHRRGAVTGKQAARMSLFCFSAGPAFLVGAVGGLTGSTLSGWLLMGVQAVTVILLGVIACRIKPLPAATRGEKIPVAPCSDFSSAVVSAVRKTSAAMLQVCLYVIVFAAAGAVLSAAGVSSFLENTLVCLGVDRRISRAVLPVLMEVTGGCVSSVGAGLPMMAFAVGFGGLSVQMQVLSITGRLGVSRTAFFAMRCLQGIISALLTALSVKLLPDRVITASAGLTEARLSGSPQGAIMLVVMCAMCVLCLPRNDCLARNHRPHLS